MTLKMANNAWSTLASAINTSAVSLTVQSVDASLFPELAVGEWCPITVIDAAGNMEIMKCTARAGATLTVERAQESTSATAFEAGASVSVRITKAAIETFVAEALVPSTESAAAAEAAAIDAKQAVFTTSEIMSGYRNKIINGDFEIQQREPVAIPAGSSGFPIDRMQIVNDTNVAVTPSILEILQFGEGEIPGEPKFKLRLTFAAAPTSGTVTIQQKIEEVATLNSRTCTMRGYFTGPENEDTLSAALVQHFGSWAGASADVVVTPTALNIDTVYSVDTRKRNALFAIPSVVGKTLGTPSSGQRKDMLIAQWILEPRHAGNYDLAHWSLVEGDMTVEEDPFSARHKQQEMALCQRYYEVIYVTFSGNVTSGQQYTAWVQYMAAKNTSGLKKGTDISVTNFTTSIANDTATLTGFRTRRTASGTGFGEFFVKYEIEAEIL